MKKLCFSVFLMLSAISLFAFQTSKKQPNVILILADDQGWGDLSLHKNPYVETPNLDKMAQNGAQFERFFVSPLCAPTRASLLTGRYNLRTGTVSVSKGLEVMNTEEMTLGEVFKANNYQTGLFGKWHNGQHHPNHPNDQGFDTFFGFCAGHWSNYFNTTLEHNGKDVKTKGYITDVLTDKALKFIKKNNEKPFFCYVAYNTPHSPHQVPDKYFNKYKNKGLDNELASIYGMVDNMDENVGRIKAYLKQSKLDENTIIIYMSDNGPNGKRYNGDMKGIKMSVDEGGGRVPCFVEWKDKIRPNTVVKTLAAHIDILPTLVDLCGLKSVSTLPLDGISLVKQLLESPDERLDRTLFKHINPNDKELTSQPSGLRNNQYRLVIQKDKTELYDMIADPSQSNDIATEKPEITAALFKQYQNWFTDVSKDVKLNRPTLIASDYIRLSAYESQFSGALKYKEGHGWVHDWLIHWTSPKDAIQWTVDVSDAALYEVTLEYICLKGQTGSTVEVAMGNQKTQGILKKTNTNAMIESPDRVPRKEVYEKRSWSKQTIGKILLPKGIHQLVLTAPSVKEGEVAEFNAVILKKVFSNKNP